MIGDKIRDSELAAQQQQYAGALRPGDILKQPDPWEHRSLNMRCRTCMHYVSKPGPSNGQQEPGRCRRHAPTMNGFPVVFATEDWCGDHKLA